MLFILVLLAFISPKVPDNDQTNKKKCDLDYLEGEWYGEYTFYSGTKYLLSMNVEKADLCSVTGTLHWPDYFNSKSHFEGKVKDGILEIRETDILQGIIMDLDEILYKLPVQQADTAAGTAYNGKDDIATFKIRKRSALNDTEIDKYQRLFNDHQKRYGTTKIYEKTNVPFEEVVNSHRRVVNENFLPYPMEIAGTATIGQLSFPIELIYKPERNFYMTMSFQNTEFLFASNGRKTWSYDPTSDKVEVKPADGREDGFDQFSNGFIQSINNGFKNIGIYDAHVDSIASYRIVMKKDDELRAFYFSKENFNIIREEANYQVKHYLSYTQFDSTWIPTLYLEMNPRSETNKFLFKSFTRMNAVSDAIFELPEDLTYKIAGGGDGPRLYDKAEAAFENEAYEKAIDLYSKMIINNSSDDNLFYKRGIAKYMLEDNYGAIGDFERAIDLNSGVADYYNRRGLVKYRMGDYMNAKKDFNIAVQKDSTLAVAYMNKAYAAYYLKEKDTALLVIDQAIRLDSTNTSYYLNKGGVLVELSRYSEGLAQYKKVLAMNYTDDGTLLNKVGVAHFKLTQYDSAIQYFQQALIKRADDFQIQKNLAEAYYYNKSYSDAIPQFENAMAMNQEDDGLPNYLGLCHFYLEDYSSAIFYMNKAIALNGKNATYFDNRAYAYTAMAKYQEAIGDFTTSINLYADDPEIYYQRGLLKKIQNNRFDACGDFKKASDMGHESAKQQLAEDCNL